MSQVIITISDDENDGSVDFNLSFEPSVVPDATPTNAQYMAVKMMEYAQKLSSGEEE